MIPRALYEHIGRVMYNLCSTKITVVHCWAASKCDWLWLLDPAN